MDIDDLDNNEDELVDKKGNKIKKDLAEKAMIGDSEEANLILNDAREIFINEIKYRKKMQMISYNEYEFYYVSQKWYKKWKEYVKYKTVKKTCRTPEIYIKMKPITFKIKPELNPGEIDNDDIIIKYKSNTLINEECYPLDKLKSNKKDYKIFLKKSFDIFKNRFGCKNIVKIIKRINRKLQIKSFDAFFLKFNVILIPRKESFIENPKLKIYNVYIPQLICENELNNYFIEIFNSPSNKHLIKELGITILNHNLIKIYTLIKYNNFNNFEKYLVDNIDKIKNNEKINVSEFIKCLPNRFQMNQLEKNSTFVLEFSEEGAYFMDNNIETDIIYDDEETGNDEINNYNNFNSNYTYNNDNENEVTNSYSNNYYMERKNQLKDLPLDKENNKHGLVGLNNIGNTCYMNTALQCLSNCNILTNYFLNDTYLKFINKDNPIGSKGKLVESYAEIIKHLWYGLADSFSPNDFKEIIGNIRKIFKDFQQQDSQEFLSFLLDGLHEDLNKVLKKPYIAQKDNLIFQNPNDEFNYYRKIFYARNQSIIIDLFYGIYKSILYCPNQNCNNISNTFDPYSIITLSLNNNIENQKMKNIQIYFLYADFPCKILNFELEIKENSTIKNFRQKINYILHCGVNTFQMYFIKDKIIPILIDETKYNTMDELIKFNENIFLYQIQSIVFGKDNSEELKKNYDEIIRNNNLVDERANEFDKKENYSEENEETFDKEKWIRCIFNNYSYEIKCLNDDTKNNYIPKDHFNPPKIYYFNKEWNNEELFHYFAKLNIIIYENNNDFMEKNFGEYASNIEKYYNNPDFKLTYSIHEETKYPFFLFYKNSSLIFKENENENNISTDELNLGKILLLSKDKFIIKEEIEKIQLIDNKTIKDYQLNFNIVWYPDYLDKIKSFYLRERITKPISFNNEIDGPDFELTNLLEHFGKLEQLTEENKWYCPKCKEHQLAKKKIEIYTCPEILLIHFKRFKNNYKLGNLVKFPIEGLDMEKFIHYKENENSDNVYDLFAISNHVGNLDGGHYFAYCKNIYENKWYEFNDSSVSLIDENNIVSKNAYVLFYKKRNTKYKNIEEFYNKPFEEINYKV
jgi:ubiquitin carboxyl-terminal hydrolase 4/11/15